MISCVLKDGIGNMMFMIAYIEYEAKINNYKTGYYNVDQQLQHLNQDVIELPQLNHAFEYLTMFKNFKWHSAKLHLGDGKLDLHDHRIYDLVDLKYEPIIVDDNVLYEGFFQSEKYFPDREFVLNLFEPSNKVCTQLQKYNHLFSGTTCSIHVRRGDYLKPGIHIARDLSYYQKGINIIGEVDKYLIFSDDLEWCKKNFIGDEFYFIENEKDYVELFLQSKCTHNIISSSTFSWWGAYLNTGINKKIVAPKKWFKNDMKNDIVPDSWLTT